MSWTYKFLRYDTLVISDPGRTGRFTFKIYKYYLPSLYIDWSKGNQVQILSKSILLTEYVPDKYTSLGGELSSYYYNGTCNITNMNTLSLHSQPVSYGIILLLYLNKSSANNVKSEKSKDENRKYKNGKLIEINPWELNTNDFTLTLVEIQIPFTSGYVGGVLSSVQTTAGQLYDSLTIGRYATKYTWTYTTNDITETYWLDSPIINDRNLTLCGGSINVNKGKGLLFPPTRKVMWLNNAKNKTSTPYFIWSFEVLVDTDAYAHKVHLFNAGTKFKDLNNNQWDICSWIQVDPTLTTQPQREFGKFLDMINRKRIVDITNRTRTAGQEIVFTGDFVSQPIPLQMNGQIDSNAALGRSNKVTLSYLKYKTAQWKIGERFIINFN